MSYDPTIGLLFDSKAQMREECRAVRKEDTGVDSMTFTLMKVQVLMLERQAEALEEVARQLAIMNEAAGA